MRRREFLCGLAAAARWPARLSPRKARRRPQAWPDTHRQAHPALRAGRRHRSRSAAPGPRSCSQAFGQQFVIENRGGAERHDRHRGRRQVARPTATRSCSRPNAPLTVLPSLRKTPYDPVKSFDAGRPRRRSSSTASSSIPPSASRPSTEMVDYAKKNPGKLAYGSSGNGTSTHLRLEMLKYQDRHRHPARALSRRRRRAERRAARHRADDERARCHCRTSRPAS